MSELVGLRIRVAPPPRPVEKRPERRPPAHQTVLVHLHADQSEHLQRAVALELLDGLPIAVTVAEEVPTGGLAVAQDQAVVRAVPAGPGLVVVPGLVTPAQLGRLIARRCGSRGAGLIGVDLSWALGRLAGDARRPRRGVGISLGLTGCGVRRVDASWADSDYLPRLRVTPRGGEEAGAFVAWIPPRKLPKKKRLAGGPFVDLAVLGAALGADGSSPAALTSSYGLAWPQERNPHDQLLDEALVLADLYRRLLAELSEVAPGLAPEACWSAGSIATHALRRAGVRPPAETSAQLPPEVLGAVAGAFHGGRVEALDVGVARPMALFDLSATYPAVLSLLGLTGHLGAATYRAVEVTDGLDALLRRADLDELVFDRATWVWLGPVFAIVEPHGERLPSMRQAGPRWRSVVAPLELHGGVLAFHAADLLGPALDGAPVKVVRAFRIEPVGIAEGLRPVRLPSGQQVDLVAGDLGRALVAERHSADAIEDPLVRARRTSLTKSLAVSLAYGVLARVDRREERAPVEVEAIGPDGGMHRTRTKRPELAGPFTLFHLGSAIPAACRAILDLACRDVTALGDTVAATMTDAIVVSTDDPGRVAEALHRYDDLLHPDGSTPAWKAECNSVERPTIGLVAGVNKLLLGREEESRLRLVRSSDTALGEHLLDPSGTKERLGDGRTAWSAELEERLLAGCVAAPDRPARLPRDLPAWAELPACHEQRVSTIAELRRLRRELGDESLMGFARYMRAETGGEQTPVCLGTGRDPATWRSWPWRLGGSPCRIAVLRDDDLAISTGTGKIVVGKMVRDRFRSWLTELDPTVSGPRRGVRQVAPVDSHPALVELVGRSGERAGEIPGDEPLSYGTAGSEVMFEQARRLGGATIARRAQVPPRTARRLAAGAGSASVRTTRALVSALSAEAAERRCRSCGAALVEQARSDARYCSSTCRQRERRSRRGLMTAGAR